MEIKTCEEYVVNRVYELEAKLDESNNNCDKFKKKCEDLNQIIRMYENIFMKFGKIEHFEGGSMVTVRVANYSFEDEYEKQTYDILTKKFPDMETVDFR